MMVTRILTLVVFMVLWAGVIGEKDLRDLSQHSHHENHQRSYKDEPYLPAKCHPQTFTKYKTIYKERKAEVINQIEIRNPRPQVKKITEQRYTTIRYPVFITQVIKPLLTQIETKVKPVFFTETVNKHTTVLFTVTGIGQATVTTLKYETEYITRCMNKGGYHRSFLPEEGVRILDEDYRMILDDFRESQDTLPPPPGLPYGEPFDNPQPFFLEKSPSVALRRRFSGVRKGLNRPQKSWRKPFNQRRRNERRGLAHLSNIKRFSRKPTFDTPIHRRSLEASALSLEENPYIGHTPLEDIPTRILA